MLDRATAIVVAAAVLSAAATPARAQLVDYDHVIAVAGSQAAASQILAKEVLLVALDIDRDARLASLRERQDSFGRTLQGLRNGDQSVGLPAAATAEISLELDQAGAQWVTTKAVILEGLVAGSVTAEQVAVLASHSVQLMSALEGVAARYAEEAAKNRLTSMLGNALLESIRGSVLSQRMATEFLLVAYGHDVEANRARLGHSVVKFNQAMSNLVNGNLERRLLPPPNDAVRDRIQRAQRVWEDEFRPIIRDVLDTGDMTPAVTRRMVDANDRLLDEMTAITTHYVAL